MISDHKQLQLQHHHASQQKRRLSGAKKSPDSGESSSGPQIIPAEQIYEIPRSQDIKKQTHFLPFMKSKQQSRGYYKEWRIVLLVFIGRRPTSVMRKETHAAANNSTIPNGPI
jgi:hypothetical protein